MENKQNQVAIAKTEIVQKLNSSVNAVLTSENIIGFEKAYMVASAIEELKGLLTAEYMRPIMALQGNKLGFKTDKDTGGGYPEAVVKNCLIEAVLMGVQPSGNQFNIIAGNMYITKEGLGYLLSNFKGLSYQITAELPRINAAKDSAAIGMNIEWNVNGIIGTKKLDIPVKMNNFMGTDAVIGKATRKARYWLWSTLTGSEMPEGDIQDVDNKVISTKINGQESIVFEDLQLLFFSKENLMDETAITNAKRILDNKETLSYSKLLKELQSL